MSYSENQISQYLAAIRDIESGGNYSQSRMGELGAYGIQANQWNEWAAQAGVPGAVWHNQQAQDTVASFKFRQYLRQWGTWELALVAWFAGPQAADQAADLGIHAMRDWKDRNGTTISEYVDLVTERYEATATAETNTSPMPASTGNPDLSPPLPTEDLLAYENAHRPPDPNLQLPSSGGTYLANRDPLLDIWNALRQPPEEPVGQMESMLTGMLDMMSNRVAGGSRTNVGATVDIAPLEVEESA